MTFDEFKAALKIRVDAEIAKIPRDVIGMSFGTQHRAHLASLRFFRNNIDHHNTTESIIKDFGAVIPSPFCDAISRFIIATLAKEFDESHKPQATKQLTGEI